MVKVPRPSTRTGWIGSAVVAVLLIFGIVALVIGVRAQRTPVEPPLSNPTSTVAPDATDSIPAPKASSPSAAASRSAAAKSSPSDTGKGVGALNYSTPTSVSIPAIKVTSSLLKLGLNKDKTVEVPPLSKNSQAGWYKYSPTPGQVGPSIIVGHIDSKEYGEGIFFRLGSLKAGNGVDVTRADGKIAHFTVTTVARYPKTNFPTQKVYGNIDHPGLRLITCGGSFDSKTRSYRDNIVAYATLRSVRSAK